MSAPDDVRLLAERRADARAAKDFAAADTLRDEIAERGWVVVDEPGGFSLQPAEAGGGIEMGFGAGAAAISDNTTLGSRRGGA